MVHVSIPRQNLHKTVKYSRFLPSERNGIRHWPKKEALLVSPSVTYKDNRNVKAREFLS
jgi:hypothetical protein